MIRVFCIDIGYSLKRECRRWKENAASYPGQALYGINHFEEFQTETVFEWCEHGYFYGKWYAPLDEIIKLISLVRYRKDYDLIYIPHAYYSRWLVVLKRLGILRKPIVVCMHNKNNLRGLITACDYVITINPCLAKLLIQQYPQVKVEYIPLLPEDKTDLCNETNIKYDVVSIGNTKRDYSTLVKAMRGLPYRCLIVTDQAINDVPENVSVINGKLGYEECLKLYAQARVIVIPINADAVNGVFGLTSLVDALCACKPIVVTKTTGLGISIEENQLGTEVKACDVDSMKKAILELLENNDLWETTNNNLRNYKINNSMKDSSKRICRIFREILGK